MGQSSVKPIMFRNVSPMVVIRPPHQPMTDIPASDFIRKNSNYRYLGVVTFDKNLSGSNRKVFPLLINKTNNTYFILTNRMRLIKVSDSKLKSGENVIVSNEVGKVSIYYYC